MRNFREENTGNSLLGNFVHFYNIFSKEQNEISKLCNDIKELYEKEIEDLKKLHGELKNQNTELNTRLEKVESGELIQDLKNQNEALMEEYKELGQYKEDLKKAN